MQRGKCGVGSYSQEISTQYSGCYRKYDKAAPNTLIRAADDLSIEFVEAADWSLKPHGRWGVPALKSHHLLCLLKEMDVSCRLKVSLISLLRKDDNRFSRGLWTIERLVSRRSNEAEMKHAPESDKDRNSSGRAATRHTDRDSTARLLGSFKHINIWYIVHVYVDTTRPVSLAPMLLRLILDHPMSDRSRCNRERVL